VATAALSRSRPVWILLPHAPADLRELIAGAGVAAPAIALGAWILLTPAMFSGTVLAAASGLALGAIGGAALSVVGPWLVGSLPSRWHEPRDARSSRRPSCVAPS
jgi:hypothetical protein